MKKFLTVFVAALLALTVFAFVGCEDGNKNDELNQYDYFNESANLWFYTVEDPESWNFGEMLPGGTDDVSMKDISTHSEFNNYKQLLIKPVSNIKPITLTKLSLQIFAEADCNMQFSLRFGSNDSCATKSIIAKANEAVDLVFENFAEFSWGSDAKTGIYIRLENSKEVGVIKYGFNGLNLTLRKDA